MLKSPAISKVDAAINALQLKLQEVTLPTFKTSSTNVVVEDTYTQVVVGLHVRKISNNGLHESELPFAPKIQKLLKTPNCDFVAMRFSAGAVLREHFHLNDVHFVCLSGAFSTDNAGTIIRAGSELNVPAGVVHKFVGIEDGLVIAIFKK